MRISIGLSRPYARGLNFSLAPVSVGRNSPFGGKRGGAVFAFLVPGKQALSEHLAQQPTGHVPFLPWLNARRLSLSLQTHIVCANMRGVSRSQHELSNMSQGETMSQTDENLKEAFAGESQANRKYLAFAEQADNENLPMVARLFRAAAAAETTHALAHLRVMGAVGSSLENLKSAARGEAAEFREMYPGFIEQAEKDGNKPAKGTFSRANEVEEIHHGLYTRAVETVEKGQDLPETKMFVCKVCGNTVEDEAPEKCPICGAPKSMFMEIE